MNFACRLFRKSNFTEIPKAADMFVQIRSSDGSGDCQSIGRIGPRLQMQSLEGIWLLARKFVRLGQVAFRNGSWRHH
jgi:hypothetical protein